LKKKITFIAVLLGLSFFTQASSPLQPGRLTCEYIENPLGIDSRSPRLSWTLVSGERNQSQSAYELIVSDNEKDILQGRGAAWSTGKINSSQTIHIAYAGTALQSFTRYYWSVRVYDRSGQASAWSEPAWFETAMLQSSDWKAQWIDDGSKQPDKDEDHYKDDPMPVFRKTFGLNKKIRSARLYICGLGYYEAYLNGKKIGDHVLDPGFSTYRKQALYLVYDIGSMLKKGNNIAGIMLGNGWYNPLPLRLFGRIDLRKYQQTGRPCVKAEIHLRYTDGSEQIIATDETWQTLPGPVIRNNVYLGEKYDARLEQESGVNGDSGKKYRKNAVLAKGPSGELTVQMQPAIKITRIIKPVKITEPGPGVFIADMGQNFAGVARIRVKGPAGTLIALRYGEDLNKDGTLNYMTTVCTQLKKGGLNGGPGAPETAWQEDQYILKGAGTETWSPRFTFHGFRYVEIRGWPGKPTADDIEGLRMNADLEPNGTFSCSNDMFNQLHETIQWTFLSNVFSVQSDCPGREKMGYGADIVVTANAFGYNYNMAGFYGKAVRDFANEQQPDGGITEIAPYTGIADLGYGGESGPLGWELVFPYLQKMLYEFYGDKRIIENNYDALLKQIRFLQTKSADHLFYWDISDHESLDPKPEAFTASAFYYHHVCLAATFAGILNKTDDSLKYAKLAAQIKNAIIRKFMIPHTGRFDNATQAAQIFALYYDLTPEKDSTFQVLLKEFERHNWHLATGIFSTKMMFDVMRELNKNDIAWRLANQHAYPGWGFMLANSATTLWETWAYPEESPSQNHPMFGSVDEWFYRSLLGINAALPGFEKIILKPQPAGDIQWAMGSYSSIRGKITSDWKIQDHRFIFKVSIPAGVSAEIWIPAASAGSVTENNQSIKNNATIQGIRFESGYAVLETGSGDYSFESIMN
jgi:alpha-L-rhamnosidase